MSTAPDLSSCMEEMPLIAILRGITPGGGDPGDGYPV